MGLVLWCMLGLSCISSMNLLYYAPQSWTHASFRPTWMKKVYLWGLSPVNSSSLYLNILSSVFLLCLGSDTVKLVLCVGGDWERERGWSATLREQAGRSGEEPGDSEHVTGGQCGGRWWDEWLRCESLSLMEASTSTKLFSWKHVINSSPALCSATCLQPLNPVFRYPLCEFVLKISVYSKISRSGCQAKAAVFVYDVMTTKASTSNIYRGEAVYFSL